MPAKSRSQQRLFGMVRAAQKGELEAPSPKVSQIAATTSVSSVKKFAKTKHKGLPEKKKMNENNPRQTGIPNNPNILQRIDAMLPGNAFSYQGFKQQTYSPTPYKSPYTGPNYTGNKVDVDNYRAGGGNAAMAGGQTADQVRAQGAKNLKARPKQPNVHNWTDNGVKNYAGSPPMRFKVGESIVREGVAKSLQEKPGDGYLGPTMKIGGKPYGIPNPIRIAQDVADTRQSVDQAKVDFTRRMRVGNASMPKWKPHNKQNSTATKVLLPGIEAQRQRASQYNKEEYETQQQKAEYMMQRMVNQARGAATRYDAAKKAAQNVKTTPGSVTVRAEEVIIEKRDGKSSKDKG